MPMRFVVWPGALCGGGVSSRSPPCFTAAPGQPIDRFYRITVALVALCSFVLRPVGRFKAAALAGTGSRNR